MQRMHGSSQDRKLGIMSRPLQRLRALRRLSWCARQCGQLDEQGALGELGLAYLSHARALARAAGCLPADIDDVTADGLAEGRENVSDPERSRVKAS